MKKLIQTENETITLKVLFIIDFILVGLLVYGEIVEMVYSVGKGIGSFLAEII
ncbi:MAG: hypothetical protein JXR31_08090 [Prolixibacteraceae bacterium]|nr:hypothetical protein [Prolixibacteraceae bacterium]MBN2774194.1 hypothetical protein [Prolixibacteraceae bacterium]